MIQRSRAILASGTAATLALILGGPPATAFADGSLDDMRDRGKLRAAFVNERPFGYIGADGQPTGEAPEIARVILERIDIGGLEGALTEWPSLIPGLDAGRWDVIAAGMYITPERCEQVLFTEPTYRVGQSFLVPAGNPKGLRSYDDVRDNPDVILGIMDGAVEAEYAARAGIPGRQIEEFPTQAEMGSAVRAGRVDAVALSTISIARMAEDSPRVEMVEDFDTPAYAMGYGAFAFRLGDAQLRDAFNEALVEFVGTDEHLELVERFGFTADNLPDIDREALCAGEVHG